FRCCYCLFWNQAKKQRPEIPKVFELPGSMLALPPPNSSAVVHEDSSASLKSSIPDRGSAPSRFSCRSRCSPVQLKVCNGRVIQTCSCRAHEWALSIPTSSTKVPLGLLPPGLDALRVGLSRSRMAALAGRGGHTASVDSPSGAICEWCHVNLSQWSFQAGKLSVVKHLKAFRIIGATRSCEDLSCRQHSQKLGDHCAWFVLGAVLQKSLDRDALHLLQ
ncbi:putative protein lunapark-A, partial [Ixodes scapularis]